MQDTTNSAQVGDCNLQYSTVMHLVSDDLRHQTPPGSQRQCTIPIPLGPCPVQRTTCKMCWALGLSEKDLFLLKPKASKKFLPLGSPTEPEVQTHHAAAFFDQRRAVHIPGNRKAGKEGVMY